MQKKTIKNIYSKIFLKISQKARNRMKCSSEMQIFIDILESGEMKRQPQKSLQSGFKGDEGLSLTSTRDVL